MAEISVIVPVYNVEKYLCRCLESILSQTYSNYDIILIDDGSTDDCGRICDEYAREKECITVIHQDNAGLAAARNMGIEWAVKYSDSKWITFVDSDDWVHKNYLELMYGAVVLGNNECCVCYHDKAYEQTEVDCRIKASIMENSFEEFFCIRDANINVYTAWGKLYPKMWFLTVRYPEGKINEDLFVTPKVLSSARGKTIGILPVKLYYYFVNAESIMHQKWSVKRFDEIAGYEDVIEFLKKNNYKKALLTAVNDYYASLDRQIKELQKPEYEQYKNHLKQMRAILRKAIKNYGSMVPVSLSERFWLLEDVYPVRMKLYWKLKQITNRSRV